MKPRKKFCHDDLNDSVSNDDDFDDDLDDHDDKHAFFFKGVVFPFCFQLQPLSSLSFGDFSIPQLSNSTIIIKHQIKLVFFYLTVYMVFKTVHFLHGYDFLHINNFCYK